MPSRRRPEDPFGALRTSKISAIRLILLISITSRLKTVDLVIRSSQGAEGVLKKYEDKLRDVQTVPNDVKEVETCRTELKVTNIDWLSVYHIYIHRLGNQMFCSWISFFLLNVFFPF